MMMATLHGLTRSRPDLLTESLATFSTFTAPAKMPKDEIGAHLEGKLAEGEVLREFERIPKRKLDNSGKPSEFKPENYPWYCIAKIKLSDIYPCLGHHKIASKHHYQIYDKCQTQPAYVLTLP